jgi:hypothetical protein
MGFVSPEFLPDKVRSSGGRSGVYAGPAAIQQVPSIRNGSLLVYSGIHSSGHEGVLAGHEIGDYTFGDWKRKNLQDSQLEAQLHEKLIVEKPT